MVLVLAYGNPLRGDDGVAWRIAAALAREPGVELVRLHQLTPELATRVARADAVLFLDAEVGDPPGCVRVRDVFPAPEDSGFGHVLRPWGLLDLARHLEGSAPPAALVTVTASDVGFGADLSAAVASAVGPAAKAARSALARLTCRKPFARAERQH